MFYTIRRIVVLSNHYKYQFAFLPPICQAGYKRQCNVFDLLDLFKAFEVLTQGSIKSLEIESRTFYVSLDGQTFGLVSLFFFVRQIIAEFTSKVIYHAYNLIEVYIVNWYDTKCTNALGKSGIFSPKAITGIVSVISIIRTSLCGCGQIVYIDG